MRARSLFFALAALSVFAACNPTQDTPAVEASLTVSGVKDNTISVTDEGKTVKLTVKSNVSWTASCDAEWVEVDPSSAEISDNKETSTKVSVLIKKNEGEEERSANLTIGADGVDAVVVKINQSAPAVEEKVLCVWDMDKFEAVKDPAISVPFSAAEGSIVIHSNVSWKATCSDWITIDPSANTFDGENQNITVKLTIASNETDAAREGEIRFAGEGVDDLVVLVKQAKADKVNVTLVETKHPYCDVDFKVVPDEGIMWKALYFNDEDIAYLKGKGLTAGDYIIMYVNSFLEQYKPSAIISGLLSNSEAELSLTGLDEKTHYQFTAIGVKYDEANEVFVATTLPTDVEFTTASAPAAEKDYASLLGTYSVNVTYAFDGKPAEVQFTISEQYINETYYMTFPNSDFSPVYVDEDNGVTYVDSFILGYDSSNKQVILPCGQVGTEGFTWSFNKLQIQDAGVAFSSLVGKYNYKTEKFENATALEYLYYKWSSDYNKLILSGTEIGDNKLYWRSLVCVVNGENIEPKGTYSLYEFNGSTDITRVANTTTSAVKEKKDLMHPEFPVKKVCSFFCK